MVAYDHALIYHQLTLCNPTFAKCSNLNGRAKEWNLLGKIDDPYDAAKGQYPEPSPNIPGELALRIGGVVFPLAAIVNVVRDYYTQAAVNQRLKALVDAANAKTNAVNTQIESPQFAEGVRLAVEETWRTTDIEKVKRFGAILGNSVASADLQTLKDAAEHIRAVSQLTERDIRVLGILYSATADLMKAYTNLHDPNPFTERSSGILIQADKAQIARDDFYASCKRLEGFGLAIELARNPSRVAPGDYSFRPTRRGEALILLLGSGIPPR